MARPMPRLPPVTRTERLNGPPLCRGRGVSLWGRRYPDTAGSGESVHHSALRPDLWVSHSARHAGRGGESPKELGSGRRSGQDHLRASPSGTATTTEELMPDSPGRTVDPAFLALPLRPLADAAL